MPWFSPKPRAAIRPNKLKNSGESVQPLSQSSLCRSLATFGNSHQTNSTASFSANGIYVLQLAVTSGKHLIFSLMMIRSKR
jgi:hypothetical protein